MALNPQYISSDGERSSEEQELILERPPLIQRASTKTGNDVEDAENKSVYQKVEDRAKRFLRFYVDNYVLLILTAAVGVALNITSIKILSDKVSVTQVVAARSFICIFILLAMCHWSNTPLNADRSKLPLILVRGILGSAAFISQSLATSMLPLGESAFIFNSYPVVTAVLSSLFGMERLGILAWCGAIGCLTGNALIAHPPFLFGEQEEWEQHRIVGIVFALSGTVLISSTFIVLRWLGSSVSSFILTISLNVFIVLFSIPCMLLGYPMAVGLSVSWLYIFPFLMTIVSGTAVMSIMSRAFQIGPPSKVTAIYMTNTLLAAAIGVLALSEKMSQTSMIGAATILVSVLLVQTQKQRQTRSNSIEQDLLQNTERS